MTEELTEVATLPQDEAPQEEGPTPGYCRWCGAYREEADGDWLCGECERYQDAAICPTCGGLARVSLMPAGTVASPASPKKGKK